MPQAKGPSCVTVEIYLYANIPKSTKRSNGEIQTSSDCKKKRSSQATVFCSFRWGLNTMIF